MHYTESDDQQLGDEYTVGLPSQKVEGDLSPPVPMVVAPSSSVNTRLDLRLRPHL